MKKRNALLLATVFVFIIGCEDKKSQESKMPVENTTEIFSHKNKINTKEKTNHKKRDESPSTLTTSETFILKDFKGEAHTLTINHKNISIKDITSPVLLINLFTTSSLPCKGMIPYLSDLQKKYKHDLFTLGIFINEPQNEKNIKTFIQEHNIDYFIATGKNNSTFVKTIRKGLQLQENFSLPLTILYKEGNYYIYYEGATPIEMIEHDIQEIIK